MSTLEIVILSLFAGMAALALIGGMVALLWIAWRLEKTLAKVQNEIAQMQSAIQALLVENKQETKSAFESAKSSFQSLKSETKAILDLHAKTMTEIVGRINADAIVQNVNMFMKVCTRLETAINAFQKLLLDNTEVDRGQTHYAPEEAAPERTEFGTPSSQYSLGQSAQYDTESLAEEAAAVTAETGPLG